MYDTGVNSDGDLDNDGCLDDLEDEDIDNDGIDNSLDNCQDNPSSGWVSTITEDADRDGCHDANEDADDDNDGVLDNFDQCPNSLESGLDMDNDGCHDLTEDLDDDGDGILDSRDNCPNGLTNWQSSKSTDIDRDGCMDSIEDDNIEMSIYIPRVISSLFAVGSLWFVYKIARLQVDKYFSILICLIILTMPGFYRNALYFHPDFMMTFFIVLSVYFFTKDDFKYKKFF